MEQKIKVDTSDCPYAGMGEGVTIFCEEQNPEKQPVPTAKKTKCPRGIIFPNGDGTYTLYEYK